MEVKSRSLILCGVQQDLKDLNQAYSEKDANSILQAIEKTKTTIKEMNKQHSNLKLQLESSRTQVDSIKRYLIALRNISEQKLLVITNELFILINILNVKIQIHSISMDFHLYSFSKKNIPMSIKVLCG